MEGKYLQHMPLPIVAIYDSSLSRADSIQLEEVSVTKKEV